LIDQTIVESLQANADFLVCHDNSLKERGGVAPPIW
jgi:hypothetical protein